MWRCWIFRDDNTVSIAGRASGSDIRGYANRRIGNPTVDARTTANFDAIATRYLVKLLSFDEPCTLPYKLSICGDSIFPVPAHFETTVAALHVALVGAKTMLFCVMPVTSFP